MIVVIAGVVAVVAICLSVRRAPLTTILGVGLSGFAVHAGVLALPPAVVGPVTRAGLTLQSWQQRQSGNLACAGRWP
jgi:hypothetical protein